VNVFVAQAKILGSNAPGSFLAWVAALFLIWGSLTGLVALVSTFAGLVTGREKIFSKLAGVVLPLGWLLWGAALLHADPTPVRIAVMVGGVFTIAVAAILLRLFLREKD
jgi:hypothetical protein